MRGQLCVCLQPRSYTPVAAGCLVLLAVCQGGALDGVYSRQVPPTNECNVFLKKQQMGVFTHKGNRG